MRISNETTVYLFIVLMGFLAGFTIYTVLVFNNVLGFNMTKEQINETKILPYCYIQNEVLIEVLNSTCALIYGGPVD